MRSEPRPVRLAAVSTGWREAGYAAVATVMIRTNAENRCRIVMARSLEHDRPCARTFCHRGMLHIRRSQTYNRPR